MFPTHYTWRPLEKAPFSTKKTYGAVKSQFAAHNQDIFAPQKPLGEYPALNQPHKGLKDLSKIVYTHDRLRELGCLISEDGELIGLGDPKPREDFEEMLRIASLYDEQWSIFFSGQSAAHSEYSHSTSSSEEGTALWADLRTLKKVLQTEGVEFDSSHNRFQHGEHSPSVLRLCKVYDDRLKLWSSTIMVRTSPRALIRLLASLEAQQNASLESPTDDRGLLDDDIDKGEEARLSFKRPSFDGSSIERTSFGSFERPSLGRPSFDRPIFDHPSLRRPSVDRPSIERPSMERPLAVHRNSGTPRNIGWRFSDDLEDRRGLLDEYLLDGMIEETISQDASSKYERSTTARSSLETTERNVIHRGLPSIQESANFDEALEPGELIEEPQTASPNATADVAGDRRAKVAHSLGYDAGFIQAVLSGGPEDAMDQFKPSKKKGLHRWIRHLRVGAYAPVY